MSDFVAWAVTYLVLAVVTVVVLGGMWTVASSRARTHRWWLEQREKEAEVKRGQRFAKEAAEAGRLLAQGTPFTPEEAKTILAEAGWNYVTAERVIAASGGKSAQEVIETVRRLRLE